MTYKLKYIVTLLAAMGLSALACFAQNNLSLTEALRIALKNNYDIQLAAKASEAAKTNNTAGNAGMLPTLDITGTGTYTNNNTHVVKSSGETTSLTGVSSYNLNGGLQLNWTLFDGGKMFVTKRRLNQIQAQGESSFREQVLQTTYDLTAAYFDVVRQTRQLDALTEVRTYTQAQVDIARAAFQAGKIAKTEFLQACIDLNVTDENIISQRNAIREAQKQLTLIMADTSRVTHTVTDTISVNYTPDRASLFASLEQKNLSLATLKHKIEAADLALKESRTDYLPNLSLRAGYYATYTENPVSFTTSNRAIGPQISGTLTIPLYNAGETKRKSTLARIDTETSRYDYNNMLLQLKTALDNYLIDFQNQQDLLKIESTNNTLAYENMKLAVERLRLGQTTALEVHQARESYVQSATRLTNFKYNLKLAETKIRQLVDGLQ